MNRTPSHLLLDLLSSILIGMITVYKRVISPHLGAHCRYYPSCSEYAILAIRKDGAFVGACRAAWRILRCNPFTKGGIDFP